VLFRSEKSKEVISTKNFNLENKQQKKMKQHIAVIIALIGVKFSCDAFTFFPPQSPHPAFQSMATSRGEKWVGRLYATTMDEYLGKDFPYYAVTLSEQNEKIQPSAKLETEIQNEQIQQRITTTQPKPKPSKAVGAHKDGLFSPVVLTMKKVLGEEKLNKLRGKVIALHSDVIGSFVETSQTKFGKAVLVALFESADRDRDGQLQADELSAALETLGFTWLQQKQVLGILERADKNKNGAIDREEFLQEAPKTLRTNLVKLAKKNGGDLGFLA